MDDDIRKVMSPGDVLDALRDNAGKNELMQEIQQEMLKHISQARAEYFRRPVANMCFGASEADSILLAKLHPELRELIFEPSEARLDAAFWGCRHLAVRRCFMQLLSKDSRIVEESFAHQILLDGVFPSEHSFVYSNGVPMVDMTRDECNANARHFIVADLTRSRQTYKQLYEYSRVAAVAELLIVAPYDPDMWLYKGGHQLQGSYVYEWISHNDPQFEDLRKPMQLPPNFFTASKYRRYKLCIQPYGSSTGYSMSRQDFIDLFAGANAYGRYVETRVVRNGFAEVSTIKFDGIHPPIDVVKTITREIRRNLPLGMTEVPNIQGDLVSELTPSRQFSLSQLKPTVVPTPYYDKAMRHLYSLKPGRSLLAGMIDHLHANSAQVVYNGAIVSTETFVGPEQLCVIAEYVISTNARSKAQLNELSERAKVPLAVDSASYASGLVRWAARKAVTSTDLQHGIAQVSSFMRGEKPEPAPLAEVAPPVRYVHPLDNIAEEKKQYLDVMIEHAEGYMHTGFDLPYQLQRYERTVDTSHLLNLRTDMRIMSIDEVDVSTAQAAYDEVFPGNSLIDPTIRQLQAEEGDFEFIIDVQSYRVAFPALFSPLDGYQVVKSRLRTSVGADLLGSFRSLMKALMKRNFNRPRPEAPGDRQKYVQQAVDRTLLKYARKDYRYLLAHYAHNPITVSDEAIKLWATNHTVEDVHAAATLLEQGRPKPADYSLMPKDVPKPVLSTEAKGAVMVGQTIVFHTKDVIALTVGVFTLVIQRLVAMFGTNVRLAFGADEHMSGIWADEYLDISGTYVYEIDVPKFDKSQDWTCFELILHIMEMMGVHSDVVKFWREASGMSNIFNHTLHLAFCTMFGNRSGNGGTLAVNCIVLMFAYMDCFDTLDILAMLIKGDDSVLITRRPMTSLEEEKLLQRWGFSMKLVQKKGAVQFCSSVFVKDSKDKYRLLRDVVRVIEKFGRALPVNRRNTYFLDYYSSVVDTALSYADDVAVKNLTVATARMYGRQVDVKSMVSFVRYLASSVETFLTVLYGFSPLQLRVLGDLDEAVETLYRVRSSRFSKAKNVTDDHSFLKQTLVDRMRAMTDWPSDAAEAEIGEFSVTI